MRIRKKLIEVALPLEAINKAAAREKSIRHGHPSTLHLWWARRPLAAARAVIFSQMVDDPSEYVEDLLGDDAQFRRRAERAFKERHQLWAAKTDADTERGPEPTLLEVAADLERQRLFRLIEELVKWENTTNEAVLQPAREEIWKSWRRTCTENAGHPRAAELFDRQKLPAFHDPFAGGGALPLEAQRLGLEAYASDLNPVAVLINKAMIEIPPKFAGREPVNPEWQSKSPEEKALRTWKGAEGLAEDVRYYGKWMRDEAEKRIGHLYPKIEVTAEMVKERPDLKPYLGRKLTVIAWLWARTVKSPNPAFAQVDVPLASTFMLSTKAGKEAYVEPVIENGSYRFTVKVGAPKDADGAKLGTTAGKRAAFRCLMSGVAVTYDHIRGEGQAGRMSARLMAIVAEGDRGRVYLAPTPEHGAVALRAKPEWKPDVALPVNPRDFKTPNYGFPPARGADDLLRPGAGSARAGAARCPRRWPARRPEAPPRRRRRRDGKRGCGGSVLGVRRLENDQHRVVDRIVDERSRSISRNVRTTSDSNDVGFRRGEHLRRHWRQFCDCHRQGRDVDRSVPLRRSRKRIAAGCRNAGP